MVFTKEALSRILSEGKLSADEATSAMTEIMEGHATDGQIAAFLTALRMKGETVDDLTAFAKVMREHSIHINPQTQSNLTDTCGTGGDRLKTYNVSTIAALVVSGAGVPVAKHGNRSFSSKCGSADLLENLGVNINASPSTVEQSIERAGIGFMFAPVFHPSMKYASNARKEIGIRTVFNILGPLTNPANARCQLIGVSEDALVLKMITVLKNLGSHDAIVVHGLDGMDEISPVGKTHVAELQENEEIQESVLTPSDSFGLEQMKYEDLAAPEEITEHTSMAISILKGSFSSITPKQKAVRDMILMNASAGIVVSRKAGSYLEGMEVARESLESGKAIEKLELLVRYSGGDNSILESLRAK